MGKPRVLVVEDDADFRWLFKMMLENEGFEVCEAREGQDALDKIGPFGPDVIALDLKMPGMSGFEFLERYEGPVPVVVMSAFDPGHGEPLAREPFARIVKPIERHVAFTLLRTAAASYHRPNGDGT